MNYINKLPCEPERGDVIEVTRRNVSNNNGRDWAKHVCVSYISVDAAYRGTNFHDGPSMSVFDGNCNKIYSGRYETYCRKWSGKRWLSV